MVNCKMFSRALTEADISQEAYDLEDRDALYESFKKITNIDTDDEDESEPDFWPLIYTMNLANMHWCEEEGCKCYAGDYTRPHRCGISSIHWMMMYTDPRQGRYLGNECMLRVVREFDPDFE